MLKAEGLENIFKRHEKLSKAVRAGVKALGFGLLADDSHASKAVTAVVPPAGIDAEALRKAVREQYGVVLAGGQEDLKGKIFRIGHLGYMDKMDIVTALSALEMVASQMGAPCQNGPRRGRSGGSLNESTCKRQDRRKRIKKTKGRGV